MTPLKPSPEEVRDACHIYSMKYAGDVEVSQQNTFCLLRVGTFLLGDVRVGHLLFLHGV